MSSGPWKHKHLSTEERFWVKVNKSSPLWKGTPCWIWTAQIDAQGYGRFKLGANPITAHRFAYVLSVGSVPEGLTLDHLCRIRSCVNPSHLEPITNRENLLRGEGLTATHAKKTQCPQGHPYDLFNTRIDTMGHRRCRKCVKVQAHLRYVRVLNATS